MQWSEDVVMGILVVQAITMIILGVFFLTNDSVRLGLAQILLAAVTVLVYSGGVK